MASNIIVLLDELKRCLLKKYDIKDIGKVKTIIT